MHLPVEGNPGGEAGHGASGVEPGLRGVKLLRNLRDAQVDIVVGDGLAALLDDLATVLDVEDVALVVVSLRRVERLWGVGVVR